MLRRSFCTLIAGGLVSSAVAAQGASQELSSWVDSYVRQGRVIDWQQNGVSHSEGQGWGLLLAQAAGDRDAFEQLEAWTSANLAVRQDRLMAWRNTPADGQIDWRNATDGDLFRAWALLRAGRDSGWPGYSDTALAIARDIAALCIAADPRAPAEPLLLPGAEARRSSDRVLINPSYVMPRALRELGMAAGAPVLIRAADHGETVLEELSVAGQLWDWIDVTSSGFAEPIEHRPGWGFDALRIPLYLAWSNRRDHPALAEAVRLLERSANAGHVVVQRSASGEAEVESNHPGFLALSKAVQCKSLPLWSAEERSYYPDTLLMLARTAMREGGC